MTKYTSIIFLMLLIVSKIALGEWVVSISKDEMTGEKTAYAMSSRIKPTKGMSFPYSSTTAWLGVGCKGKEEWTYVGFNISPNLTDTETSNGFNTIRTRVKWDSQVTEEVLSQKWGAKFIHFSYSDGVITNIQNSKEFLLELSWHGQGKVYFKFPLKGSTAALKKMRATCSK